MRGNAIWIAGIFACVTFGFASPNACGQAAPNLMEIYGFDLDVSTVVFAFDTSGSSSSATNVLVNEIVDAIGQLDATQSASAIEFDDTWSTWSTPVLPMTPANRAALIAWVNAQAFGGATCLGEPLTEAIAAAASGPGPDRAVVFITDGVPVCSTPALRYEDVQALTAPNGVVVHAFYSFFGSLNTFSPFLQEAAAASGGIYSDGVQTLLPEAPFQRGDVDENGARGIADVLRLLGVLFANGPSLSCDDAGDMNDNGALELQDAIDLLDVIFSNALIPVPRTCGGDPTPDMIDCSTYAGCP